MPKIIPEILGEVFLNLLGNDLKNTKYIERFMLSGKAPFEAALKCFSTAIKIAVNKDDFLVQFPNGQHLVMPYDTVVLRPTLQAITKSIESLEFRKRPSGAGENIVYETLIKEGLKKIHFYHAHNVPKIYMDKIRNLTSPEKITFEEDLSIFDLSVIRPPPNSNVSIHTDFEDIISKNFYDVHYPQVETFDITGYFRWSSDTFELSLQDCIKKLLKIFPNLKNLKASFLFKEIEDYFFNKHSTVSDSMETVLGSMKSMNAKMFSSIIPKNIKGSLELQTVAEMDICESFIDHLEHEEEGFQVTDDFVKKQIYVHNGFHLKFYAYFAKTNNSYDEESDINSEDYEEYNSDEYEMYMESNDEEEQY